MKYVIFTIKEDRLIHKKKNRTHASSELNQ